MHFVAPNNIHEAPHLIIVYKTHTSPETGFLRENLSAFWLLRSIPIPHCRYTTNTLATNINEMSGEVVPQARLFTDQVKTRR